MSFRSILYPGQPPPEAEAPPEGFADLNLDQVVDALAKPWREYRLKPLYWAPLRDPEAIRYRQEVMQDLEDPALRDPIRAFAEALAQVRRYLNMAARLDSPHHRRGWILEAALDYGAAVATLAQRLAETPPRARGLRNFAAYLRAYAQSPAFRDLVAEAQAVKEGLRAVRYTVLIQSGQFKVRLYQGEPEYALQVEEVFAKFKQGDASPPPLEVPERSAMSHIEAKILDFVAQLTPGPFAALEDFCARHADFIDAPLRAFEREIHFYLAYLDFIADLKAAGLPFTYPHVSTKAKEERVREAWDLALGHARRYTDAPIVPNDYTLTGAERILVVTGPNQGGKTTFARTFGQLHYLAALGLPVPAREAHLFLPDRIFTHFERREDIQNLRGKLEDDLVRIHAMLAQATPDSLFVLNEIFASTTAQDALFLSRRIMACLLDLDVLAVWVTFLDELSALSAKTVSMVAEVNPADPTRRTFKIRRRPADGLAYALSLAHKHGLTYDQLRERLP